jgi:hypothetical protein
MNGGGNNNNNNNNNPTINVLLLLLLLPPINLNAEKENLQPFATIDFFKMWNTIMTIYWKN